MLKYAPWLPLLTLTLTGAACWAVADDEVSSPPAAQETQELPWESTRKPRILPGGKIQNAKVYLELLGVDASQWNNLFHDQPLGAADEEWINRIFYYLPRIGGENTNRWRKTDWNFAEISESPARFQGDVLQLRGRATRCQRIALVPELVDRYEFDHYYRVHLALPDERSAIVCTRNVPLAWTKLEKLDEPAEVDGIFLKLSPLAAGPPQIVCVSQRVAWLPDRINEASGVTPTSVLLAQQGFDLGLWDLLQGRQNRGLDDADREPFYRLLGAVQSLDPTNPAFRKAPPINIAEAVKSPAQQSGKLVTVDGTVSRIDRVEVTSGDTQAWCGSDHYFTLYIFVPLLKERIGLQRKPGDPHPRMFDKHFPVTVCVPRLPPGLQPGSNVQEHVQLHGVFFKVWAYRLQGTGPEDSDLPQPSPLVIAPAVTIVSDEPASDPTLSIWGGSLFVILLGVLGLVLWRLNLGDIRFKREILTKSIIQSEKVDLTHLNENRLD